MISFVYKCDEFSPLDMEEFVLEKGYSIKKGKSDGDYIWFVKNTPVEIWIPRIDALGIIHATVKYNDKNNSHEAEELYNSMRIKFGIPGKEYTKPFTSIKDKDRLTIKDYTKPQKKRFGIF